MDTNVVVLGLDRDLEAAFLGTHPVHEVLDPFLVGPEKHARLVAADGAADVYSRDLERGFLISHATGEQVWDLVVQAARAAELAIFVPGHGTCIPYEGMRSALPARVPQPVVVVRSGAELIEAMADAPAVTGTLVAA